MNALDGLYRMKNESATKKAAEDLELNGSSWVNDRFAQMSIEFYKIVTEHGSIYVQLSIKDLIILNIRTK